VRHHHEERAPRRERSSEGREDRGSRRRTGASSGTFDRPHHHRAQPVDDFFLKPYEPSPSSVRKIEEAAASSAPQKTASKQPLAALLGGFGMPRKSSSSS
jgi:transposase